MSENQVIIDSHQHFWQLSRGDYDWLTSDLTAIYRDFLPEDLKPTLNTLGVDGTILVQAAKTLAETQFLLHIADQTDFVLGVVGWVDMESDDAPNVIAELVQSQYFRGIRPMIHDIPAIDWMLNDKLAPSFNALMELELTFDALVRPAHLKNLMSLITRYPDLKLVIDHAAKPDIKANAFQPWADDLQMIAENSRVYCKLSGLMTEAGEAWTIDTVAPYINHVVNCFGSERVMWGSDWPVVNMASSYPQWFGLCCDYLNCYFPDSQANIFGGTAAHFYQ